MKNYKTHLLILLYIIILLPGIQKFIPIFKEATLNGSFVIHENVKLTQQAWFSGEFQESSNQYFEEHFGLRNDFVKIYNQVDYSLFKIAHADNVEVGKNNYLFENRYIKSYLGLDRVEDSILENRIITTKQAIDSLKQYGVKFLVVIAPGKGDYYPEYIPKKYSYISKQESNYQYMLKRFDEENIPYIDFNSWFIKQKSTTKYPLITPAGIHWSDYGATLVTDSIITFLNSYLASDLPELTIKNIRETNIPGYYDYDMAHALNLRRKIRQPLLGYPEVEYRSDSTKKNPKAIVIGDSFYWGIEATRVFDSVFDNHIFWYYFQKTYGDDLRELKNIDILNEVKQQDIIIILSTVAAYHDYDMGFTPELVKLFTGDKKFNGSSTPLDQQEAQILRRMEVIRNNPDWMNQIKEKAKKNNVTIEEMVRMDAIWSLENQ